MRLRLWVVLLVMVVLTACGGRRGGSGPSFPDGSDAGIREDGGRGSDAGDAFSDGGLRGPDTGPGDTDAGPMVASGSFTGAWSGTWSSAGSAGPVSTDLVASDGSLSGTFELSRAPCAGGEGTIRGTYMGRTARAVVVTEDSVSFEIAAELVEDRIDGEFEILDGECVGIGGSFGLTQSF